MGKIKNYLSLIKFAHTIFALPFALIGFFLGIAFIKIPGHWEASTKPGWHTADYSVSYLLVRFLLVIGCMVFARSAAMAFNRWLDAGFDRKNPRTAVREIPAGVIHSGNALWFVVFNCIAFILCCWFINLLCFYLSFVALGVILFYSYTKRFTALCHLVLGIGLGLAPIGAWLAVTGVFSFLPVLFSFTVMFWVSGFDIIYDFQDEEFDRQQHLHSIPALIGRSRALRISELLDLLAVATVLYAGWYGHFELFYWIGAAFFTGLLIYQHLLVKPADLSKVNIAFFTTNGIASVIFAGFVLLDLLIR
jgi:4-hydroxybenzoate polyprenyltransferase